MEKRLTRPFRASLKTAGVHTTYYIILLFEKVTELINVFTIMLFLILGMSALLILMPPGIVLYLIFASFQYARSGLRKKVFTLEILRARLGTFRNT